MDPENQEVIELLLQTGNRKDCVWYPSDPLGVSQWKMDKYSSHSLVCTHQVSHSDQRRVWRSYGG